MKTITLESLERIAELEKQRTRPENPNRRVILDRRAPNSDRRTNPLNSDYQGPFRRNTVDRRLNSKDRRG